MKHLKLFEGYEEINYKMAYFEYLSSVNDYLIRILGMDNEKIDKLSKKIHQCWEKGYTVEKCANSLKKL